MTKLNKLTATLFVALLLIAGACGQDNYDEVEQTIDQKFEDDKDKTGGGMGG